MKNIKSGECCFRKTLHNVVGDSCLGEVVVHCTMFLRPFELGLLAFPYLLPLYSLSPSDSIDTTFPRQLNPASGPAQVQIPRHIAGPRPRDISNAKGSPSLQAGRPQCNCHHPTTGVPSVPAGRTKGKWHFASPNSWSPKQSISSLHLYWSQLRQKL